MVCEVPINRGRKSIGEERFNQINEDVCEKICGEQHQEHARSVAGDPTTSVMTTLLTALVARNHLAHVPLRKRTHQEHARESNCVAITHMYTYVR